MLLLGRPIVTSAALLDTDVYQTNETVTIFTGPIGGGSIAVYRDLSPVPVLTSGIGDTPLDLVLTSDIFTPGNYIIVTTKEPNGCQLFTVEQCRLDSGYLDESSFSAL